MRVWTVYLNVWEDFVDSSKLYIKDGVHLNEKVVEVFAKRMDELESLVGKLDGRKGVKRSLTKGVGSVKIWEIKYIFILMQDI